MVGSGATFEPVSIGALAQQGTLQAKRNTESMLCWYNNVNQPVCHSDVHNTKKKLKFDQRKRLCYASMSYN